jgi:hypothetical protein
VAPVLTAMVVQKLSARNQFNAELSRAIETKLFQDYFGPSGPDYITAAQEVDIAVAISEQYSETAWQESPANVRAAYFDFVFDKVRNPEPVFSSLSSPDWANGLRVNVPDLFKFTDEVTAVALEAKNTSSDEWCRKYSDLNEQSQSLTRERRQALGFLQRTPLKALKFNASNRSDKATTSSQKQTTEQSDCGKKFVEDQFKYEWNGTRHIPKSIAVYQVLKGGARQDATWSSASFTIDQRYTAVDLPFAIE